MGRLGGPKMGNVIGFHVRTVSDCDSAKALNVMSSQPTSSASRTKSAHLRGGMPRSRQVLTVDNGTPNFLATALVPPSASIAEFEVSMVRTIVRGLRTSQGLSEFAYCEATSSWVRGGIGLVADSLTDISKRLELTRLALGFDSQVEFCKAIRVQKNLYNPFEKGKRRISLAIAMKIRRKFGISLDWIYFGDPGNLPTNLTRKIESLAA